MKSQTIPMRTQTKPTRALAVVRTLFIALLAVAVASPHMMSAQTSKSKKSTKSATTKKSASTTKSKSKTVPVPDLPLENQIDPPNLGKQPGALAATAFEFPTYQEFTL